MGIYKRKKIIKAYSRFPRLRIRDLMFGYIINWTPGRTAWRPAAKWMESAAQRGIVAFQRWKYPNSCRIYSTHSIIHLVEGVCWNVTAPRADYLKLQEGKLNRNKVYIVCRYRDFRMKTAADRKIIYRGIELLDESAYDSRQLLAILVQEYLGFPEKDYLYVLDPRRKTVCSPAVRGLWVKLWLEKGGKKSSFRRPGGKLHVERTPPTLMENHQTFKIVGILEGGLSDYLARERGKAAVGYSTTISLSCLSRHIFKDCLNILWAQHCVIKANLLACVPVDTSIAQA